MMTTSRHFLGWVVTLTEHLSKHKLQWTFPRKTDLHMCRHLKKQTDLLASAKLLNEEAQLFKTVTLKEDLKKMKWVLKHCGHVDANGVIQTKGWKACEINMANEVVVKLIFTGIFNNLSAEQCCMLLSCMTYDECNKDDDDPANGLKSYLAKPFYKLQEVVQTVAKVSIAFKVDIDEDEFIKKFNPGM